MIDSGRSWVADSSHEHYEAARKATKHVYNVDPDFTREGGSIPVTLTLQVCSFDFTSGFVLCSTFTENFSQKVRLFS